MLGYKAYNVKKSANGAETIYEIPEGFSVENFPIGKIAGDGVSATEVCVTSVKA